jgi:hypothetical protein
LQSLPTTETIASSGNGSEINPRFYIGAPTPPVRQVRRIVRARRPVSHLTSGTTQGL